MRILITNDDGITAQGLWILARELKKVAHVTVVAPDREQSAIGTAVTLRKPLRVQKVTPLVPDIEAYSVEGTPGDSAILALNKLVEGRVDIVVSGINHGLNLGDDVLISGTVSGALQGYLRGFPAIAVSLAEAESHYQENAARLAALLARKIDAKVLPANIFLNVNLPSLPLEKIKGIKSTRLAHKTHINAVAEGHDGKQEYYFLVRQQLKNDPDRKTDIWAVEHDYISITPLYINLTNKPAPITDEFCAGLFQELQASS